MPFSTICFALVFKPIENIAMHIINFPTVLSPVEISVGIGRIVFKIVAIRKYIMNQGNIFFVLKSLEASEDFEFFLEI